MPFAFLAPVFLAGLAALAVPILIHLSSRPRKRTVEFPSLMFLEQVEYRDSSKRRLRHIVLFALRSLALVLLAAAFARPFLDRPDAVAAAPDGGRELVVLLDRSASMAGGQRMARGREAVATLADGLRRGDRATLVTFDHGAAAVNRATDQAAVLRRAAEGVTPGAGGTRYGPALRLAESLLSGSPLPRRELVLVSDFQRSGWDPAAAPRMPAGTEIRTVDVGEPMANTFVADVRFGRERFSGRERVRVGAVVTHRPASGAPDPRGGSPSRPGMEVPVELVMDGRVLETRTVVPPASSPVTVEFAPVTLPDRAVRGVVRAGADGLPDDNTFHFVLNAGRSLRVLVVEPRTGGAAPPPYLASALRVGPDHEVATVPASGLGGEDLSAFDVVVINDADPDGAGLRSFVEMGGGLVVVLGERSRSRGRAAELLPGTLRGTRDAAAGAALTGLRREHPVFEPFRSGAGGLTGARFYRFRELAPADGADVLARFDGGAPAVVAGAVGAGRVVVLASPLNGVWSDLVLQPGFVPLAHRLVRYASGREPGPAWRTVGDLLDAGGLLTDPPEGGGPRDGRPVLLTPSDEPVPVEAGTLHVLAERGFYELRDPRAGTEPILVAVNGDPAESEPATVDAEVVAAAISGGETPVMASFAPEDRERRQALWWYFLAGAFVLMAAETVLSNLLSRRPLPVEGGGE